MPPRKKKSMTQRTLTGDRIYLRPFSKGDLRHVQKWSEDPEMRKLTGEVAPMTRAEAEKWYRRARADKDRIWFAIVLKEGDRVIGETGLLRMFKAWRCTDMTVIIGEKEMWGRGYGTEAGRLLLDHAFGELAFHRVSMGAVGFNERATRFWKGLGFREEGIQRDGYYCDGKFSEFVMMSILEDEYRSLRGKERSGTT
jgi:RimJ/RimL family protein N-acetyltransferase